MPDQIPEITRHRHELVRRNLSVTRSERITPNMHRLVLGGDELAGFTSISPEDHVKIRVPDGDEEVMREYTPRFYDPETGELWIDFAVHDAGPATLWALSASAGDSLIVGGPRGSQVIEGPIRRWVLVGDETALPAIGRRIEEMAPGIPVVSIAAVPGPEDEQSFETGAVHEAIWVHRKDPTDGTGLAEALAGVTLDEGTFVWIAAEAGVARALKQAVLDRGHPAAWLKAAGYWIAGQADASDKAL